MKEIDIKTERLVAMLSNANLGGVLLNAQHNFAWLTGGKSNLINSSVENGACFLFVRRDGRRFVLANNIEMPRILSEEISQNEFSPVEFSWQNEKSSGSLVVETASKLTTNNGEIAADLPIFADVRTIENLISKCRFSLTVQEVERYKNLGNDAGNSLGKVFELINPGQTESEIAAVVKNELAKFNVNPVVLLVGADERIEKFRHPLPTANVWKNVLLIAVCAKRKGLIVNMSRMACAGRISPELPRKTGAAAQVCAKILTATKIGASGAELYRTAANAYAETGFADEINKHHQGGACGYKTRDWVAHPKSAEIVFKNQAFAWNPSITGTKIEETCIVTENNLEIITASPNFPVIPVDVNGEKINLPDILIL